MYYFKACNVDSKRMLESSLMGLNKIMEKTVEENLSAAINVVGKAFGDKIEIYLRKTYDLFKSKQQT